MQGEIDMRQDLFVSIRFVLRDVFELDRDVFAFWDLDAISKPVGLRIIEDLQDRYDIDTFSFELADIF